MANAIIRNCDGSKIIDHVYIYTLSDPVTETVRYIGKANDINKRLKSHLSDSIKRHTPVACWIRTLIKKGLTPKIKKLVKVPIEKWEEAECLAIEIYRRKTNNLLNLADGGNQPYCSKEQRAKNGAANAKKIHGNPYRKEMWRVKQRIGIALKKGQVSEKGKKKLRTAAAKYPQFYGVWSSI